MSRNIWDDNLRFQENQYLRQFDESKKREIRPKLRRWTIDVPKVFDEITVENIKIKNKMYGDNIKHAIHYIVFCPYHNKKYYKFISVKKVRESNKGFAYVTYEFTFEKLQNKKSYVEC